ncbi:uncharacterized protein DS421_7g220970 [Arachis hypogaea]|nr:uncharacterized protein DS421_7g220970 [Arachis hypogaea]
MIRFIAIFKKPAANLTLFFKDLLVISFYMCVVRIYCRCMSVLLLSPPIYAVASLSLSPFITAARVSYHSCLWSPLPPPPS